VRNKLRNGKASTLDAVLTLETGLNEMPSS